MVTEIRLLGAIQAELAAHATAREAQYRQADPSQLARSLPGFAEISAPVLVAAMGRPGRFRDGTRFKSYAGLAPGEGQDPEDLVQETYLRAYAAFSSYRGENTRAWLAAICLNVARSQARRRRGRPREVPGPVLPERVRGTARTAGRMRRTWRMW
jgi:hypothetical protein